MTDPHDPLVQEPPERLAAMVHELRHRLRNAFAVSGAIALAGGRAEPEHQPFAADLARRFAALSLVQARLLDSPGELPLPGLAAEIAGAFAGDGVVELGCLPEAPLGEQHARLVALMIAELCAASLRDGALAGSGRPTLAGMRTETMLTLTWREPLPGNHSQVEDAGSRLLARLAQAHRGRFAREQRDGERTATLDLPLTPSAAGAA